MANINRVVEVRSPGTKQPKFGSGPCMYGTIGKGKDGYFYMWTGIGVAINLSSGQGTQHFGDLGIVSLEPLSIIELSVNEGQ